MEVFDGNEAAFILNLSPRNMDALIGSGEIEFMDTEQGPLFTWNSLERYISENEGLSIMEAQRYIADRVFEKEHMLV